MLGGFIILNFRIWYCVIKEKLNTSIEEIDQILTIWKEEQWVDTFPFTFSMSMHLL